MYLQFSQYIESLLFYKMFIIHVKVHVHIHKYISHYCFVKCILSTPLDYCDLFCIRNNRDYRLCEICSDNREIAIIASAKIVAITAIITSTRKTTLASIFTRIKRKLVKFLICTSSILRFRDFRV